VSDRKQLVVTTYTERDAGAGCGGTSELVPMSVDHTAMTPTEVCLPLYRDGYYPLLLNGKNRSLPNQACALARGGGP
jgi:hypothetical protein